MTSKRGVNVRVPGSYSRQARACTYEIFPRVFPVLIASFYVGSISLAGPQKPQKQRQSVLFTRFVGISQLPAQAYIPEEVCTLLITDADRIVTSHGLKAVAYRDLSEGGLNLRVCATESKLSRLDRDLAVGLYAVFVHEQLRREESGKALEE